MRVIKKPVVKKITFKYTKSTKSSSNTTSNNTTKPTTSNSVNLENYVTKTYFENIIANIKQCNCDNSKYALKSDLQNIINNQCNCDNSKIDELEQKLKDYGYFSFDSADGKPIKFVTIPIPDKRPQELEYYYEWLDIPYNTDPPCLNMAQDIINDLDINGYISHLSEINKNTFDIFDYIILPDENNITINESPYRDYFYIENNTIKINHDILYTNLIKRNKDLTCYFTYKYKNKALYELVDDSTFNDYSPERKDDFFGGWYDEEGNWNSGYDNEEWLNEIKTIEWDTLYRIYNIINENILIHIHLGLDGRFPISKERYPYLIELTMPEKVENVLGIKNLNKNSYINSELTAFNCDIVENKITWLNNPILPTIVDTISTRYVINYK